MSIIYLSLYSTSIYLVLVCEALPWSKRIHREVTYSVPPLAAGAMIRDPQWVPEITETNETYVYWAFSCPRRTCHKVDFVKQAQ